MIVCFFKEWTADEMRIRDWSSDVCSSDLVVLVDVERVVPFYVPIPVPVPAPIDTLSGIWGYRLFWGQAKNTPKSTPNSNRRGWSQRVEIGRASCRERLCQFVLIVVVSASLKKQHPLLSRVI